MAIDFRCDGCGRMLRAGEAQEGRQARCPSCGGLTTVPTPEQAARAAAHPWAVAAPDQDAGDGLRLADRDEGGGRPPGRPAERTCPGCGAPLGRGAVLCVGCGFDLRLGRRRKTKVKRLERHWTPPPSPVARLVMVAVGVPVAGFVCLLLLLTDIPPVVPGLLFLAVTALATLAAGWYHTLHLTRDRRGALLLTRRTYFCFAPVGDFTLDLAGCEAVHIDAGDPGGSGVAPSGGEVLTWVALVLAFGWLGAVIVRHSGVGLGGGPVRFAVRLLSRPRRKPVLTLYRGTNEAFMRDLVDTLQEQGELEVVR